MGLAVGRIELPKTLICFQPSPEAGDGQGSQHPHPLPNRAASLLAHCLAGLQGKLCDDSKIRTQEARLGHMP